MQSQTFEEAHRWSVKSILAAAWMSMVFWPAKFVSGAAIYCLIQKMGREILEHFKISLPAETLSDLLGEIRTHLLLFEASTYAGSVGLAIQPFHVGAFGICVVICAERGIVTADRLRAEWISVETEMLSGLRIRSSVELLIGKQLPDEACKSIEKLAEAFSFCYRTAQDFPGVRKAQEVAGKHLQTAVKFVTNQLKDLLHQAL